MTQSVFKYSLAEGLIGIPKIAKILNVGMQDGIPCLWTIVDPNAEHETRYFTIIGTGSFIPDDWTYVGTMFEHQYVWHVFETPNLIMEQQDE